jgi:predicted TIM-barrel fold metal-dependent hydrolase
MAHAGNSNAGGEDFGRRADPAFWLDVVRTHPDLRILLGHFGGFATFSAGQQTECSDGLPFDASWEAVIGRFVAANPDSRLFAHISYLSEIFRRDDRARALTGMRRYLELDRGGRHLIFGSDWIMLGVEREFSRPPGYVRRVADFLAECGLDEAQIRDIFYGNAIRFLGLDTQSRARGRLLQFYAQHGLPPERLPS